MSKDYNQFDNKAIEDSISQIKDSMSRLQETIQNSKAYSFKNIHFNNNLNNLNDSMSTQSRLGIGEYNPNKNISINNYIDNSNKLNNKRKNFDKLGKKYINNSNYTEVSFNNKINNNYIYNSFKT